MTQLNATIFPVMYFWRDDDALPYYESYIGVLNAPICDAVLYGSAIDSRVFYWFETLEEIAALKPGDAIADSAILVSIGNPENVLEMVNSDCE